ncbi:MAG: CBS domain-containing protein [Thermodesulfobacteriota bacterium]|nr:CBS domain-containing protein [Thermodesulfobacteriota bacterium]
MKLREFMTTRIESIDCERSLYDAIEKMVDRRIRSLVVVFPGNETDNGVITARDIVFKALAKGIELKKTKASDIASRPLFCVDKNTELDDMARSMQEADVARIFVCDGKKIIGVVSLIDLMTATLVRRARGNDLS